MIRGGQIWNSVASDAPFENRPLVFGDESGAATLGSLLPKRIYFCVSQQPSGSFDFENDLSQTEAINLQSFSSEENTVQRPELRINAKQCPGLLLQLPPTP
jgi:hypothetical protein